MPIIRCAVLIALSMSWNAGLHAGTGFLLSNDSTAAPNLWAMAPVNPLPSVDITTSILFGTAPVNHYYSFEPGAVDRSVSGTALPVSFGQFGWRSANPLCGSIASGTWTANVKAQNRSPYSHKGRFWVRYWRGAAPDGSDAGALSGWFSSGENTMPNSLALTTDSIGASFPSASSFYNEYLFAEFAWQITQAAGNAAAGLMFYCDEPSGESLSLPAYTAFTPTRTPTPDPFATATATPTPSPAATLAPLGTLAVPSQGLKGTDLRLAANFYRSREGALQMLLSLAKAGQVSIEIYSIQGNRVRVLGGGFRQAGLHPLSWDGRLDDGSRATTDLYILRVKAGDELLTKKLAVTSE